MDLAFSADNVQRSTNMETAHQRFVKLPSRHERMSSIYVISSNRALD